MPRETDLLRVKLVAHTLLDVQIQETALSPVIVSHPFTNSGISALRNEDGSLSMVDLINNLVVSHSGGGMLRQGTRKGIRRTPANRGMRAHWVVKGLDISEDVCHGMCP